MEKEFSKNLISRVPIALLMAAVIILALAYGNSLLIKIFILAITILAALELLNFIGRSVFNILFLASALIGILFLQENIKVLLAIFGFYLWTGIMILMAFRQLAKLKIFMPYMMIIFLSIFLSSGILISSSQSLPINGNLLLFLVILNTALIDIGAYLFGNLFGVDLMLYNAYFILFIIVSAVLFFGISNVISDRLSLMNSLKLLATFLGLFLVCFLLASGDETVMKEGKILSALSSKFIGAALFMLAVIIFVL